MCDYRVCTLKDDEFEKYLDIKERDRGYPLSSNR